MQQGRMPDAGRVHEVFEQVLAQPEFRELTVSPLANLLRVVSDLVARFLDWLIPDLGEPTVQLIYWVLFILLACTTAIVFMRWLSGRLAGNPQPSRASASRPEQRTAAGWAQWARAEMGAGRLREAATGLYQAVILHLEASGKLRYGEWKTPGDYALEMSESDSMRTGFRGFLGLFVEVAFGPVDPTAEALESLFTRAERLGCRS